MQSDPWIKLVSFALCKTVKCDLFLITVIFEGRTFSLTQTPLLLSCLPCVWQWGGGSQGACDNRWLSEVPLLVEAARPRTEPQLFWMAKCWGSKRSPFHRVVRRRCAIDLTTRRRSRPSDWIYCANMVPKLSFTHHCQLPYCIPCRLLSSNICHQFWWFMRHILVSVLTAACVCSLPCRFGCWRKVWAPRFLRFFCLEAVDKGKGEALMFWQQFAVLMDRGERLNTRRT